jgi:hypothetical protein
MSHRTKKGDRVGKMAENATEPKAVAFLNGDLPAGSKLHTKSDGTSKRVQCYTPPAKANPGNVIKCSVGGGRMGHPLAHENEAPFPTSLVEFFVKSFCPPGGTIIDPFCGSGTTLQVGMETGRNVVGIDIRDSQTILSQKRLDSLEKGQKDAKESN